MGAQSSNKRSILEIVKKLELPDRHEIWYTSLNTYVKISIKLLEGISKKKGRVIP